MNSFWIHAQARPSQLALVEPDGTEHRASQLLGGCNQVAHGLRALGLGAGDTVATLLPNGAPMVEVALATGQVGMFITPINFHLTAHEVAYILEDAAASVLIFDARFADLGQAALAQVDGVKAYVVGDVDGVAPLSSLVEGQPTDLPKDRLGGFAMTYTSGTTGKPRGVRRPSGEVPPDVLADNFAMFLKLFGIADAGVHLVVAPQYHTAVLNFTLYSLHLGHTAVVMDKWTPEGMLERIDRYSVTHTHMVPTHFGRLLSLSDEVKERYDVSSMTHAIHGAAPCPIPIKEAMLDWWGPVVYEYYAASEGGGTLAPPAEWLKKKGTVGRPWPISRIEIRDDDGTAVAPDVVGTVWISMGDHRFEYHGDEEKTDNAWSGSFFTVGDAGYLDADGYLFLVDRKADMIISGGVNIYPAEIECELILHPKVADCAAFGIPNEDWGEEVKGVVELEEGVSEDEGVREEILAFCRERLASYKCPKTLDFIAAMPRDPNGKLYKRKLRDPYWEDRERAI